jgi:hypothetical protein
VPPPCCCSPIAAVLVLQLPMCWYTPAEQAKSRTKHNHLVPLLIPYHALLVLAVGALNKQRQHTSTEQIQAADSYQKL